MLECGGQGACPSGFECQAETQRCVPLGAQALCHVTGVEPLGGLPGLGGAGPDGAGGQGGGTEALGGSGSSGDAGPAGGTAGVSGAGATVNEPPGAELAIVAPPASSASACTGGELSHALRASGGVGPYTWRLAEAPPGAQPSEGTGTDFEVTGVPTEPGALVVELEDSTGKTVQSGALIVYESPQIENVRLPPICLGEAYAVSLVATGGQPDGYVWSGELLSGGAASLAQLGLAIQGSTLAGDFSAYEAAPVDVSLRVHDERCSTEVALELDVVSAESDECPQIQIVDAPFEDALPAPCRGNSYAEALTADGGEPPYVWQERSLPPGLRFDAELATLSGVARGDGALVVELTDQSFRTIQKRYEIQTRDKCWTAYVAAEPGPARLELVDGRLLQRQPEGARRTLPADAGLDAVFDFAFSPEGRFLAYRLGRDASALRLVLVRLSDGKERAIDLGGAVARYAWSSDASTLAVAFTANAQTFLGGVDVSAVDPAQLPGPELGLDEVERLERSAVPSVDSDLVWYGDRRLGFLTRDPLAPERRRLVTTALEPARFAAPSMHMEADFSEGAHLLEGPLGVFVAEPESGESAFFPSVGEAPIRHATEVVISPAGAFTGLARDAALEIFRASEASGLGAPPSFAASGCTTLLAWASERDRLACAIERDGENQVALFDLLAAPSPSLIELPRLRDVYVYPAGAHSGRRRLLSSSGRWLAFTTDDDLYVARLDADGSRLRATLPASLLGTKPGALAFSPDEGFLLIGAGNVVSLLNLDQGPASLLVLSASAAINDSCSERFVEGRGQWCGGEAEARDLSWSSGSDVVAFRSSLGTLQLVDVSRAREGSVSAPISPDGACSEACGSNDSARFQP